MTPAVGTEPVNDSGLMPGCRVSGEQRRGQRRPFRRLEHHRVARRQRRPDPPGGQHQRRVPRRDDRGDPGRVVGDALAVPADLARLVRQLLGVVGEEPEVLGHPGHDAAPVRAQQRAVVPGLHPGQVLDPGLDAGGDPAQHGRALGHRQRGPGRERGAGRVDRPVHLGRAAGGDLAEHALVDRRHVGEGSRRGDPFSADPVPGVDRYALDLDAGHCVPPFRVARVVPPFQTTPTWR
jgi:hypothetical protein